jgi:hypothetical protein
MIKEFKINPLNVFGARQVSLPPPHFEFVNIPIMYNLEESIANWIQKKLKNRFYIGKNVILDNENKIKQVLTIGFEDSKEMSYFMLACPLLKYK